MAPLDKKDTLTLENAAELTEGRDEPLAKALAKMLIEKGILSAPDLLTRVSAEKRVNTPASNDRSPVDFIDSKGKRWINKD